MMTIIKKNVFYKTIILLGLVFIFSCSQDPIFFTISTEPVPVKPRIPGGPTNMAVFSRVYPDPDDENLTITVPIMYVASGSLYWYARTERGKGDSRWDLDEYRIPQPNGKIISLTATDKHLYALCLQGSGADTVLRRIGPAENEWKDMLIGESKYTLLQSIYGDITTGRLFAGARNPDGMDCGILYLDDTTFKLLASNTELLSGAASRQEADLSIIHYLSTRGRGIFWVAETDLLSATVEPIVLQLEEDAVEGQKNRLFIGMIKLPISSKDGTPGRPTIIAVERNGGTFFEILDKKLYLDDNNKDPVFNKNGDIEFDENGYYVYKFRQMTYSNGDAVTTGRFATGALALWQQVTFDDDGVPDYNNGKKMLIAGIQGGLFSTTTSSSYTHGYVEFDLNPNGSFDLTSANRNNSPSITVNGNTDRYTATIGKHPINHMYQASKEVDTGMTFFASTQTAGLWSYRDRDGGLQWNAEN